MDWNDVRYFLALARSGSIRGAGAELGVSHSTVARRVMALEEMLATRLFDRNRDGYTLTDAGRSMVPGAERVEREMSALERGLVGTDERLSGPVAITCCDGFVSGLLMRPLADLVARYPEIELCLTTDSRPYNLSKREADIAIRILAHHSSPPEHLIGTKLVPLVIANYVARVHRDQLDPADPSTRWLAPGAGKLTERLIAECSYPELRPWGTFSTLELFAQAAEAGLGITMLPTYVGDRRPTLERLPQPDLRHVADIWLLSHPDLRDNARFRAVRRTISEGLTTHRALFEGGSP